jgi:hypothetical protein
MSVLQVGDVVCIDGKDDYCGRIVATHPLSKPPSYDVKLDSDTTEAEYTFSYLPQSRLKAYTSKWGGRRKSRKSRKARKSRKSRK